MWSLLLPSQCSICGRHGPVTPCPACWPALRPAPPFVPPPELDRCRSLLRYESGGRELLARLKYRNARNAVQWLAAGMAALVGGWSFDVVTWAPTTAARRNARGYDQAELLARAVARRLEAPVVGLLVRSPGPAQTGLTRTDRRESPHFHAARPPPARVLVVDDILTTGATLTAAATTLRRAGALGVVAVTAGRTPFPGHEPAPAPSAGEPLPQ